ncbi:MAG: hypothetical protein H7Z10_15325 [Gemmatimonadaceae bacterium]|nr:hypothetical protein [Acetobacteraceae bacterium]
MIRMPIRFLALFALLCATLPAQAAPREVEVTANGLTTRDAITEALVQAIEQTRGVVVAAAQVSRTELSAQVKDDQKTATLSQEQQSATLRLTGGYVSSYRVLSTTEGTPVSVRLAVVVEVFEARGLGNETRRRIAVATFAGTRPGPTANQLRERITAHLVQARRFAVVDRAESLVYAQEMALLEANAPAAERTRIGQLIGADYVVTGRTRQVAATSSSRTLDLTGEVVTSTTAGSAEVEYQVIEIATRQIKWAGSARITGAGAIEKAAFKIAEEITQTIYPMRLIRFDNPANLIINQGGDSLRTGQRFRAMVLGETMTDPYTQESLGQLEEETGIVEVRRVDSKISYAQLVSGSLPRPAGDEVQIVLRPAPPPTPAPARARRPAGPQAPSVTKLPFDL